ncbi:helix-turn-helix domain-containing protein [Branchiibius sp. NY16-3462-2]|uniref:helix-turn-helix domain-containing protein n=1 Tax=Branchiibius sp. NY16-3462-2 TaxID=1807500 RepID=UPI000798FDE7|nr:helix-turn-helix domain-containing protein [Branchiibius sp. NY16-3462-2]KYH45379.1 hypothetical protein AZH51_16335 [Branchiibius sp. NY16-3462-2]
MVAEQPQRRKMTAKEAAARLGVSVRTVQRIVAEPREEYLARAAALREQVLQLREVEKLPYKEISERLGIPASSARRIIAESRKQQRRLSSGPTQAAS